MPLAARGPFLTTESNSLNIQRVTGCSISNSCDVFETSVQVILMIFAILRKTWKSLVHCTALVQCCLTIIEYNKIEYNIIELVLFVRYEDLKITQI